MSPASLPPLIAAGPGHSRASHSPVEMAPMRMSPVARVALLIARAPHGRAVVADLGDVQIGDGPPYRGGLLKLKLPGRGGGDRVSGSGRACSGAADAGAVGHEAIGDPAGIRPLTAGDGGQQLATLETFEAGRKTRGSDGARGRGGGGDAHF